MEWKNLSHHIPNFEYRQEQLDMMHAIETALEEDKTIMIEAGTGTGKNSGLFVADDFVGSSK